MPRRPQKSGTPLDTKQQELAHDASVLREKMRKLEQMIEEAPRKAEETNRRKREDLLSRATEGRSRLDVSVALHDTRWDDGGHASRPRKSLRKQRREGRIVFIVLVIALFAAVVWLASHLHF